MRPRADAGDLDDLDAGQRTGALSKLDAHARIMTDPLSRSAEPSAQWCIECTTA
jgi:hypothetical protein